MVDGTTYRRVVRCQETYITAAGPVQVERTLYKNRSEEGERAISTMELRLGVVEGRWTPLAAQQAVWVVGNRPTRAMPRRPSRRGPQQRYWRVSSSSPAVAPRADADAASENLGDARP